MPSNTLLVTLSPPGKTYYLPSLQLPSPHSPPSPTPGYSSEPEITPKKANRDGHVFGDSASTQPAGLAVGELASPCVQHRRSSGGTNTPAKGSVRTAAYQQLFEYVFLSKHCKVGTFSAEAFEQARKLAIADSGSRKHALGSDSKHRQTF